MENKSFDLIVLGGGPGGIEAAVMAAQNGLKTALISNQKPGGRAVWGSLVPSKVWLTTAESSDVLRHSSYYALGSFTPGFELENLRARIVAQSESASMRYRKKLQDAGVELIEGKGILQDRSSVQVQSEQGAGPLLKGAYFLVASGSEPVFTASVRPVPPRIFAPRHAATLQEMPKSLLVIGGGVTGVEYAYTFAALGVPVTLLHSGPHLLPRLDTRIANAFEHFLHDRHRIQIKKNDAVQSVRLDENAVVAETASGQTYRADYAFLGTGRKADATFFDPALFDFSLNAYGALVVNEFGQTNHPNIYAAGDITGAPMTANRATMQARVAVSHILQLPVKCTVETPLIEMAYTHPPIGQIGDMTAQGNAHFIEKQYATLLKAHLEGETAGLMRIKIDDQSGQILGAAIFGPQAAEILGMIQLAMLQGISYHKLRAVPLAHPSFGELISAL